jgi:hypothetical protein
VVGVRRQDTDIVLMVEGGYAFRVPFRSSERAFLAEARIGAELEAHRQRMVEGAREARDAVEPGEEARFLDRQRKRIASDYRSGHQSLDALVDELLDVDFQLQQRLGAAVALAESTAPRARDALMAARATTASHALRNALDALIAERADDAALIGWVSEMHPKPRRFAPVGQATETPPPPARIDVVEEEADGPRIATDDEEAIEEAAAEEEVARERQR